jgi:RecA-family ATPase
MSEFKFDIKVEEVKWLIENLVPMGQLNIVLAQAGVGKSLLVENLAVSVVYGQPFCDFDTVAGDVLIIDQDTPEPVLNRRLLNFSRQYNGIQRPHTLYTESMKGFSLYDNTLCTIINDHPTVKLVIIDSLHSVCGKLNPNFTSDMSRIATLKERCLNSDTTIIINHHITQKDIFTIDELMIGETGNLAMGNSAIIQQADSYFIVGATADTGRTNKLYIRPVSKRVSIPTKPIILNMAQNGTGENLVYGSTYEPDLDDVDIDIMTLFREQKADRTVKEVYEAMGQKHGKTTTRKSLARLEQYGKLLLSRHKANLFRYRLP